MEKGVWSLMDAFNGDEMRSNVNIDYSPEESQAGIKKKKKLFYTSLWLLTVVPNSPFPSRII